MMSITRAIDSTGDMCWCPTPGCGYGFVKNDSNFNCPKCRINFCLDCKIKMHTGLTCKEFVL
jgi:IBR domain, a half RING-finger domain